MSDSSFRLNQPVRNLEDASLRLGRLPSPSRESHLRSLFSNLRDFLLERPVKIKAGTPTAFDMPKFGTSLGSNLQEFFHSGPRGSVRSGLLVNWHEEPSLWANLRDLIAPRKLPPLKTTSQPIPVPEIWSKDKNFKRMQVVSILVHGAFIALIVLAPLLLPGIINPPVTKAYAPDGPQVTDVSPYQSLLKPSKDRAGGGGGAADKLPPRKGTPPKFANIQIARPVINPPKSDITFAPVVLGNPDIKLPTSAVLGDPFGKGSSDSLGQGHGNGIGNGNGNGVGPGEGYGTGGGTPWAGTGGYGSPACLYCPKAEYSDEAMKVKVQGVVELTAFITPDGRATEIHVAKGLGLGLDEKAIEAVRTWRLKPALGPDGRPATVRQIIEVSFQLF